MNVCKSKGGGMKYSWGNRPRLTDQKKKGLKEKADQSLK
jgi:hypothetical protein